MSDRRFTLEDIRAVIAEEREVWVLAQEMDPEITAHYAGGVDALDDLAAVFEEQAK